MPQLTYEPLPLPWPPNFFEGERHECASLDALEYTLQGAVCRSSNSARLHYEDGLAVIRCPVDGNSERPFASDYLAGLLVAALGLEVPADGG